MVLVFENFINMKLIFKISTSNKFQNLINEHMLGEKVGTCGPRVRRFAIEKEKENLEEA